jgi:acyl-CoA thioesterase-2
MIASFQDVDDGVEHFSPPPADVPDPETLPSTADLLAGIDHPVAQFWATQRAFDIRHIDKPLYLSADGDRVAESAVWMKAVGTLPDDPNLHRAAIAYASDHTILEPVLRGHGIAWVTPGLKVASLDHAMWWHRDGRADEWLLYIQESPNAIGGRGLSFGRVYDRAGNLLASIAQEGMIRVPSAS